MASGIATAQPKNNDYYQARGNAYMTELLAAVEKHHEQLGIDWMRAKSYPRVWGNFHFILNYFPNHPRVLLNMVEVCEVWRDPRCDMEGYFDKALRFTADNPGVHLTKGVYLQKRGKLSEAIESYKKALELNPNSANAHYNLGLAYLARKDFTLANEHAQQANALGMKLPGLRNKLIAAGAWKPIEPKSMPEAAIAPETTQPGSDQAKTPGPGEPAQSKPSETETKPIDGGK